MTSTIIKLNELLNKYYDALEIDNIKKQEAIYNEYSELKKDVKSVFDTLSKSDRKTYKMICSEFRILSSEQERNKLFEGINKSQSRPKTLKINDDLLNEAKTVNSNTTNILKKSLQEIKEAGEIGNNAMIIIDIDNSKLQNINNKMDEIESDSKIAIKLITTSLKRFYTDKMIIMFTFIVVCLIIVIVLFKYKIIV